MEKNIFFWNMLFSTVVIWSIFNVIVPFYPNKAKKFNLSYQFIGVVVGIFSIGSFTSSLLIGKYMHKYKKSTLSIVNYVIYAISTVVFGLLHIIENKLLFELISVLSRIIQGVAVGIICTIIYSFARKQFGDKFEQKIALLEAAAAIGFSIGPFFGSFLIHFFSFLTVFIILSIILLFCGIFNYYLQNKITFEEKDEIMNNEPINYRNLINDRCFFITYLYLAFTLGSFVAINSKISISLQERFHLTTGNVGYIIFIGPLNCFLTSVINYKVKIPINNKLKFFIGNILFLLALFLVVPHTKIYFPESLSIVIISYIFFGVGAAFIFIPVVSEFTIIIKKIGLQVSEEKIDAMAAAMFVSLEGIGEFIAPTLGGIFYDAYEFEVGQYYYICLLIVVLLIYLIFGNGYEAFTKPLENFEDHSIRYETQDDEKN